MKAFIGIVIAILNGMALVVDAVDRNDRDK